MTFRWKVFAAGRRPECLDDLRVQLGDRHLGVGVDDDLGLAREGGKRLAQLLAGDVLLGAEVAHARAHEPVRDDDLDLRLGPACGRCRLRRDEGGDHGDDGDETPAHGVPIVGPPWAL